MRNEEIEYKSVKAAGLMLGRNRKLFLDATVNGSFGQIGGSIKNIIYHIQIYRNKNKTAPKPDFRKLEEQEVKNIITKMYQGQRKDIFLTGMGGFSAVRNTLFHGRYAYSLTVPWGWRRKVYNIFYKEGKLPFNEWFVFRANEVRINQPTLRLFEGVAYNFKESKIKPVFIGMDTMSGRSAIRENKKTAIEASMKLVSKTINKEMRIE